MEKADTLTLFAASAKKTANSQRKRRAAARESGALLEKDEVFRGSFFRPPTNLPTNVSLHFLSETFIFRKPRKSWLLASWPEAKKFLKMEKDKTAKNA